MNWKDCTSFVEKYDIRTRFDWPSISIDGFDCEEAFTISDVTGLFGWLWTYPGDWLLRLEPIASFFEYAPNAPAIGAMGSNVLMWIVFVHVIYYLLCESLT